MLTFYVMQDSELPGVVKVGKDTGWPGRFKQARCHTPGKITVPAVFHLPDLDRNGQEKLDTLVKSTLQSFSRDVTYGKARVKEWYDIDPEAVVHLIQEIPEFTLAELKQNVGPALPTSQIEYEDWRDRGKAECRWRAFLFQIADLPTKTSHQHIGRLKLAAGSLYDTAYRYNFTYCPFPVLLIGGFETELSISENNQNIMAGWQYVVENFGNGSKSQPMGWLKEGLDPQKVCDALATFGCRTFPLYRPKPIDARPKDPSLSATDIGAVYSGDRVVDFFTKTELK